MSLPHMGRRGLVRGTFVLVDYPDDDLFYHERLVLGALGDGRFLTASPEFDVFPMILACPPLRGVRVLGDDRALPPDFLPADCHRFNVVAGIRRPLAHELNALYAEADPVI